MPRQSLEEDLADFVSLRAQEGKTAIKAAEKLFRAIEEEAALLRLAADTLGKNGRDFVTRVLARGFERTAFAEEVLEPIESTIGDEPAANAEDLNYQANVALTMVAVQRSFIHFNVKPPSHRRSRSFSPSWNLLFEIAKKWRFSDAELARRLDAAKIDPEGPGSDEPDRAKRWETNIKAARKRRRKVTK